MKAKNYLILVLMVILVLPLVSAGLIPTTAPCWYKGTVTDGDIAAEGLTVDAYKGATLLKSGTITGGVYSLNSVGANDGDTITLQVYGATFNTSTFVGYCKTGNNPWVVKDFNISKQANGASCNNNAICTSGTCSSGTCSSGGGGGGGSSSTTTTPVVVVDTTTTTDSSTSGSSGGGSGIDTTLVLITVPGVDTIEERNEIVSQVTEALDINTNQVAEIEQESVSDITSEFTLNSQDTTSQINNVLFAQNVQDVVNSELDKYDSVQVTVNTKVKVIKVTKTDGSEQKVTKIEKEITISASDIKGNTIRVIQVIPKEVASSASKLSGNFIVLEDDPVLAFDIPVTSILNGKVNLDYTIAGDVLQSSLNKIVTSVVDKTTAPVANTAPSVVVPTNNGGASNTPVVEPSEVAKNPINYVLIISIVLVIIIIIVVSTLLISKKKKQKTQDNYLSITYSYSSTDPTYRQIKDYIELYKYQYSEEQLVEALHKANFPENLIDKVLSEEYKLYRSSEDKSKHYYLSVTYNYSSKDPTYRRIKDYIERYKHEYSKVQLVEALRKEKFSEDLIKKVLQEEYK